MVGEKSRRNLRKVSLRKLQVKQVTSSALVQQVCLFMFIDTQRTLVKHVVTLGEEEKTGGVSVQHTSAYVSIRQHTSAYVG